MWQVYYFDFYCLVDFEEFEFMGICDYFSVDVICLVEWLEKGYGLLLNVDFDIDLCYDGDQ